MVLSFLQDALLEKKTSWNAEMVAMQKHLAHVTPRAQIEEDIHEGEQPW